MLGDGHEWTWVTELLLYPFGGLRRGCGRGGRRARLLCAGQRRPARWECLLATVAAQTLPPKQAVC